MAPKRSFFRTLVNRPVTLLTIFTALIVVGWISYARIPIQMMPDGIVEPGLSIRVQHPGASALENEQKVTRILEENLRTLTGVDSIRSGSRDDFVWIWVAFDANLDMDLAKAEVRDRVERARPQLPDTVEEIGVYSFSDDQMPILWVAVMHPGDSDRTDFLIDTVVQRRIEGVDGVGRAEVYGVLDDSVRILLDENRVRAANMDIGALIRRLSSDNFAMPMGEVDDGGSRILLRSDMRFGDLDEIEQYPIGQGLVVGDVGEVIRAKSVRNRLFKINGQPAYFAEIQKDSQANVVATCRRVGQAIEELKADPRLAGEFDFLVLFDQGEFIESSLGQLQSTALWGGGLAVLVLFVFLRRVRTTLCVALSIPTSVLLSIAWLYFSGGSFNVLTMTGVTLALGMLVDNSVVVIENISRLRAEGKSGRAAAVEGTREIALAVSLATLTTVVVFAPMIFMTSNPILRLIFGELGTPLCLSLLFSLLVALVFLPVVSARVLGDRPAWVNRLASAVAPIARIPGRIMGLGIGAVRAMAFGVAQPAHTPLRFALDLVARLRWPLAVAVVAVAAWQAIQVANAPRAGIDLEQFGLSMGGDPRHASWAVIGGYTAKALLLLLGIIPWMRRRRADLPPAAPARFVPRESSPLELLIASNRVLLSWSMQHRWLAATLALFALGSVVIPSTDMEVAAFGEDENAGQLNLYVDLESNFTLWEADQEMLFYEEFFEARREQYGFENMGNRFDSDGGRVSLYWNGRRTREQLEEVQEDIKKNLVPPPGHEISFSGDLQEDTKSRNLVTFNLVGPDSERLAQFGAEAVKLLEKVPGLSEITTSSEDAPEQVQLVFDSDLAETFGVTPDMALQNISWALRGWQLPRYQEDGREVPLILEYDEETVAGLGTLRDMQLWTGESSVPLSAIARMEFSQGSDSIRRQNGQVTFTIQGRVDDPLQQRQVSEAGYAALSTLELPRGYAIGEDDLLSRRQEEEMKEIKAALLLSVVLVFLLMGILFESFLLPFSVLFTIPFAYVGAMWTLYLTGTVMDSVGWIGIIILVGVVVNNGIVLIDRIHRLRGEGMERTRAVVEGSATRVRPIVMTALTTVIGLLPMALSEPPSQGIDYRALATCVAGGLAISTFFTLWVVPLAYTVFDDFSHYLSVRMKWSLRPARGTGRGAIAEHA